ncbi:hypothetical protein MW887_001700, partial [Aspergillus wentii]
MVNMRISPTDEIELEFQKISQIKELSLAGGGNLDNIIESLKIDVVDQNKRTPLSCAAEHGALQAVKLLFDNGANINSEDDEWGTPLMHAMDAGYP